MRWGTGVAALIGIPTVWMLDVPECDGFECMDVAPIAGGPLSWTVTALLLGAAAWAIFAESGDS